MPTLVTIPFSHYCEKARWALDYTGYDYVEEGHVPVLHRIAVKLATSPCTSVPVLVTRGGCSAIRRISSSTQIPSPHREESFIRPMPQVAPRCGRSKTITTSGSGRISGA